MKLKFYKRAAEKKSEIKKIRRDGDIPASIYIKGKSVETIAVKGSEFTTALRGILPGHMPTAIFTLFDESGKERRVLIKEIQYHVTTYQPLHLDFEELLPEVKVNVKVPIEFTGVADCIGVKLGGVIRQVIRHVKVRCLPKDIPSQFPIDVKELAQGQSIRLSEIQMPQTVRPLVDLNEVAVVITLR